MFEKYSYKIKFKALLVVFVMLSIAAYRRSFSSLLATMDENKVLKEKVEMMGRKTRNVDQLSKEIADLDRLIGKEGTGRDMVQQNIVGFISENNGNVHISDLKAIHEFVEENYKIYTYQLDLIGNYNELAGLAYDFEKNFEYSKIVSMKFYTEKKNNKPDVLHLKMIFQNYENTK